MSYFDDVLFYTGIDISSLNNAGEQLASGADGMTSHCSVFLFSFHFSLYIVYSNVVIAHQDDLARKFVLN